MKKINVFIFSVVMTVILICGAAFVQNRMEQSIRDNGLIDEGFADAGTPPVIAFTTVALGGFRGVIADALWLRSITLQEEGKYFELVQLADWIQKLQPKFAGASAFLGWNMAYNVSVTCRRYEDRWRWINKGIETLTDAVKMSPNDPDLYRELGWVYQHKLGNYLDDAQRYYKYELAKQMLAVLGSHYPDWQGLAAAPANDKDFLLKYPAVTPLRKAMREAGYDDVSSLYDAFTSSGSLPENLKTHLTKEDAKSLEDYLRAKWLRDKYFIDPAEVVRLNGKYGEFDWLTPEPYSIYWAEAGVKHAPDGKDTNCELMILHSLRFSFTSGRMLMPGGKPSMDYVLVPNLALADSLKAQYLRTIDKHERNQLFKESYRGFLRNSMQLLYSYGKEAQARKFYDELRNDLKDDEARKYEFEQYVLRSWEKTIEKGDYKEVLEQISSLIMQSCILVGYGDAEGAAAHLRLAQNLYVRYTTKNSEARVKLPPFDVMKKSVAKNVADNFPAISDSLRAAMIDEDGEDASSSGNDDGYVPEVPDKGGIVR